MNILFLEHQEHPFSGLLQSIIGDYNILKAETVEEAMEIVRTMGVTIIIMDCMLFSSTDLKTLRAKASADTVHIIGIISDLNLEVVQLAVQSGADSIIVHSLSPAEFTQRLQQQIATCAKLERTLNKKMKGFTTNVAHTLHHEFRTPLNAVLNFTDLLHNKQIPLEDQDMAFDSLHNSARRLYATVEKFLLYAEVELLATYAHDLSMETCDDGQDIISAAAIDESVRCHRSDDLHLDIDSVPCIGMKYFHFQFIVCEILHNAFKFSEAGNMVYVHGCTEGNQYKLTIADKGRGMTLTQLSTIGVFQQFDRQRYEQQGVGLGLAIVKKILPLFAGTIHISSTIGDGTTVTMTFPIVDGETVPARQKSLGFLTPFEFERQHEYEMEDLGCLAV